MKAYRLFGSIFLLGFASGLPLALTGSTLQAWLTQSGASIVVIGWFSLAGQPYVYKVLWAPLLDRFSFSFLDRRRSWILLMQLALIVALVWLAILNPKHHAALMAFVALLIAFFSATQDTVYDAYRTDILQPSERGLGSTMMVTGYRVAIIMAGGFALVFAKYHGWRDTYLLMALLMLIGVIGNFWALRLPRQEAVPRSVRSAYIEPIKEFLNRRFAWWVLLMIVLYKLGDAFTLSLSTTFLLRGLHFSLVDLGVINKIGGLLAAITGGFLGGFIMMRLKLFPSLMLFGILQAVSNLTYMLLAIVGKSYAMMATAVILEHLFSGMGTVAFLALLMALCDHRYSATQFALFSVVASLGRVYVGPVAGVMVKHLGWTQFYFWAFVVAIPGLLVLWYLRNKINFSLEKVA